MQNFQPKNKSHFRLNFVVMIEAINTLITHPKDQITYNFMYMKQVMSEMALRHTEAMIKQL